MNTQALRLFENALEVEGSLRGEFLSEACGGDAELRLEVELMLADAGRADVFFGEPKGATFESGRSESPLLEQLGDVIGPYKLVQKIGEGGFGVIWMAEQSEPIRRTVAVKVIKAGMDTRQVLARFEVERQALFMKRSGSTTRPMQVRNTPTRCGRCTPWRGPTTGPNALAKLSSFRSRSCRCFRRCSARIRPRH